MSLRHYKLKADETVELRSAPPVIEVQFSDSTKVKGFVQLVRFMVYCHCTQCDVCRIGLKPDNGAL